MASTANAPSRPNPGSSRRRPIAPGPRYYTPLPFLKQLRADSLGLLTSLWREFGDVLCIRMGPLHSMLVARPEYVRQIFVSGHRKYEKGNLFGKLKAVAGNGLLFSEGDEWQMQRHWVGPAFQRGQVEDLVPLMGRVMNDRFDAWERERVGQEEFDLMPEMSSIALDMVCRAMFGADPPGPAFHHRVDEAIGYANYLLANFITPPLWVPTRRNRAATRTLDGIRRSIREMVFSARSHAGGGDLMQMLTDARDEESGRRITEPELLDQMLTLLVAGHETTAMALSWSIHLLGRDNDAWQRLRDEADRVLSDELPTAQTVQQLEFSERVVKESMRLYPPVYAVPRQAKEEDEIGGYRVPRKATVTISPWIIQRHPEFWEAPERFDPDRFLPERSKERPRYAYFPFGAGGRSCVGEHFAMLEATLVLSMIARRYDVLISPDHPVEPDPILTLRPRFGVRGRLVAR